MGTVGTDRNHAEPRARTPADLHLSPRPAVPPLRAIANDETLNKLVRWMNLLAEKLEYPKGTVAVALVNGKN